MHENIITADFHGGVRAASTVWHLAKEIRPEVPLCGETLHGNFKRSKGAVTCGSCNNVARLDRLGTHDIACLRALAESKPLPRIRDKWYSIHALLEGDFVYEKSASHGTKQYLTHRGKVAIADLDNPAPWMDPKTRVVHARKAWYADTLCGEPIPWPKNVTIVTRIEDLHKQAKKLKTAVNCMRCAIKSLSDGKRD